MTDLRSAAELAREVLRELRYVVKTRTSDNARSLGALDLGAKAIATLTAALEADGWRKAIDAPEEWGGKEGFIYMKGGYVERTIIPEGYSRTDHHCRDVWIMLAQPFPLPPPPQGEK